MFFLLFPFPVLHFSDFFFYVPVAKVALSKEQEHRTQFLYTVSRSVKPDIRPAYIQYIASDGPESAPFLVMNFVVPARGGGIHPSTSTINYIPYMPPPPPHTLKKNGLRKNEDFQREKKHVMTFCCRSIYFMEN